MAETQTHTGESAVSRYRGDLTVTRQLLVVVYGLVPIVAGLDKFVNVLAEWETFLPTVLTDVLPVEPQVFMYVVGAVEVVAGLIVLAGYVEYGAYLVAVWLVAIAGTQVLAGNYDVAVRDVVMAVGAVALAQLAAARDAR